MWFGESAALHRIILVVLVGIWPGFSLASWLLRPFHGFSFAFLAAGFGLIGRGWGWGFTISTHSRYVKIGAEHSQMEFNSPRHMASRQMAWSIKWHLRINSYQPSNGMSLLVIHNNPSPLAGG